MGIVGVWPPSFYNCYSMARHNGKIYERKVAPLLIVIVYPLDAHTHTHTVTPAQRNCTGGGALGSARFGLFRVGARRL